MKSNSSIKVLFAALILFSCNKEKDVDITCENISHTTLYSNSPVVIGQMIQFGTQEVGGYRIYDWKGPNSYTNQYPDNSLVAALEKEGWYYLNLFSSNGSCQKIDSLYIDVKLQQGVPACSIATNTTSYNNLPTDNYSLVKKYIDPNFSQKTLLATGPNNSNLTIYFHTHWRTNEPEDGIYNTIDTPVFVQTDNNYNKVFITTTKSSIYWASNQGQNVYISHIGSKLQVRFCNIIMGGNNGVALSTSASGNVVEQ
jgi:hypothetical protein